MRDYIARGKSCPQVISDLVYYYIHFRKEVPGLAIHADVMCAMLVVYICYRHSDLSIGEDFWWMNREFQISRCFVGPQYSFSTNLERNEGLGVEATIRGPVVRSLEFAISTYNDAAKKGIQYIESTMYGKFLKFDISKGNSFFRKGSFNAIFGYFRDLPLGVMQHVPDNMTTRPLQFAHQKYEVGVDQDGREVVDRSRRLLVRSASDVTLGGGNGAQAEEEVRAMPPPQLIQAPVVPAPIEEPVAFVRETADNTRDAPVNIWGMMLNDPNYVTSIRWGIAGNITLTPAPGSEEVMVDIRNVRMYVRQIVPDNNLDYDLSYKGVRTRYMAAMRLVVKSPELNDAIDYVTNVGTNVNAAEKSFIRTFLADYLSGLVALGCGVKPIHGNMDDMIEVENWSLATRVPEAIERETVNDICAFHTIQPGEIADFFEKLISLSAGIHCVIQAFANYMKGGTTETHSSRVRDMVKQDMMRMLNHLGVINTIPNFGFVEEEGVLTFISASPMIEKMVECVMHRLFVARKKAIYARIILDRGAVTDMKIPIMQFDDISLGVAPKGTASWLTTHECFVAYEGMGATGTRRLSQRIREVAAILKNPMSFEKIRYSTLYQIDFGRAVIPLPEMPAEVVALAGAYSSLSKNAQKRRAYPELEAGPAKALSLAKNSTVKSLKDAEGFLMASQYWRSISFEDMPTEEKKKLSLAKFKAMFGRHIQHIAQEGDEEEPVEGEGEHLINP